MDMDFELGQLLRNLPSFFRLAEYRNATYPSTTSSVFIQAYMLNSNIHTQRCKLHIKYISSEPKANSAHSASRNTCLHSAREIIRAEQQLLVSCHPFVRVRLRLAGILYSVFMASIVLLMDACVHRPSSLRCELQNGEVADALAILKDARSHSLAAANLYESLMQLIARHQAQFQPSPAASAENVSHSSIPANTTSRHVSTPTSVLSASQQELPTPFAHFSPTVSPIFRDQGESSRFTTLEDATSLDSTGDFRSTDTLEWDILFQDILTSSFF
jgi:hypothetical protein